MDVRSKQDKFLEKKFYKKVTMDGLKIWTEEGNKVVIVHFNISDFWTDSELLLRIITACICGVIIGYERMNRNKEAGVRTHGIVALSASLIMIVSKYGFEDIPNYDAARVAAQVVSGIGFIGAGIIFIRNKMVSGLTTAAGIWATAGIGLAIGSGLYYIGIIATFLIVILQVVMHKIPFLAQDIVHSTITFTIKEYEENIHDVRKTFISEGLEIGNMTIQYQENQSIKVEIEAILPSGFDKMKLIAIAKKHWEVVKFSCN